MTRRILRSVAILVATIGLLDVSHALAGTRDTTFRQGVARVVFASPSGLVASGPLVTVSNGRPGLVAAPFPLSLRNTGTIPLDLEVEVVPRGIWDGGLGDGLLGIVRAPDGAVISRGWLADIRFRLSDLRPGETRTCDLDIRWPRALDANRYQGRDLAFDLRAMALAASP